MSRYYGLMVAMVMTLIGAGVLHAQQADLDAAIAANFGNGMGGGVIAGFGANGATPVLVPANGLSTRQAIRNVQASLDSAGYVTFSITTNTFGGGVIINWGHNAATAITSGAAGEIVVATGTTGTAGGAGGNATANTGNANCAAYAVGGFGAAPNGAGGWGFAVSNGSNDCWAEAYGGDGMGTGSGGFAIADSATTAAASGGYARAVGGATSAGTAGDAQALADGDSDAVGGDGDPATGTSIGGNATATTFNGSNLGPAVRALAMGGNAAPGGGGIAAAFGPNPPATTIGPNAATGAGGASIAQ